LQKGGVEATTPQQEVEEKVGKEQNNPYMKLQSQKGPA